MMHTNFMHTEVKMAIHALLEQAINRLLQIDPQSREKILPLCHKTFALELTDIEQTLVFYFTESDIMLRSEADEIDVHLSGKIIDLVKQTRQTGGPVTGKFRIQGDIESAQQFQRFVQSLNLDWEEALSHVTGDVVAHKISGFARGVISWGQQAADTTLRNVADYLQTESEINPDSEEMQGFSRAIDAMRDDTARLQARITRIKRQFAADTET